MPEFRCANGHRFDNVVVEDNVTETECKCGALAIKQIGAPNVKSGARVSKDEVKQYMAQFGKFDKKGKPLFVPKNRDELSVALKQEGVVPVSDKEFMQLATKAKPEPPPLSNVEKSALVDRVKARREEFRSAYDSGSIPKPDVPADVQQAAASEIKGA